MTVLLGQGNCQAFTQQENIELMMGIYSILCFKTAVHIFVNNVFYFPLLPSILAVMSYL